MLSNPVSSPAVSVVVCTKDRLPLLQNAIRSLRDNNYSSFELLVIDQSADSSTQEWVESVSQTDPRIRYIHNPNKGVSRSRSLGVQTSVAPLILMMDDDCEAEPGWIQSATEFFRRYPEAMIVFGSVVPAAHDQTQGRISGGCKNDQVFQGRWSKIREDGTGANSGFRRTLFEKIGLFDPFLGLGAGLFGSEDWDLAYRSLLAGLGVYHCSAMRVIHHGFKPWQEALETLRHYEIGTSAMFVKYWRCGDWMAPGVWLVTFLLKWKLLAKRVFKGPRFFSQPRVIYWLYIWGLYVIWNLQGIQESFRYRVDRRQVVFQGPS